MIARVATALAGTAVAASGCGAERDAYEWRVELAGLDRALLAAAVAGDEVVVVGGDRERGAILAWDAPAQTWREAAVPASAGALWWAWADGAGAAFAVGAHATCCAAWPAPGSRTTSPRWRARR